VASQRDLGHRVSPGRSLAPVPERSATTYRESCVKLCGRGAVYFDRNRCPMTVQLRLGKCRGMQQADLDLLASLRARPHSSIHDARWVSNDSSTPTRRGIATIVSPSIDGKMVDCRQLNPTSSPSLALPDPPLRRLNRLHRRLPPPHPPLRPQYRH
jgi:hypothetical protein